jgi:hypothetical protein
MAPLRLTLLLLVIAATAAAVLTTPAEAAAPRSLLAKPTATATDKEKPTGQCTAADELVALRGRSISPCASSGTSIFATARPGP